MEPLSVNDYLDTLNEGLSNFSGRVIGEVTEVQMYPGRTYLFYKIKDKENEAILTCFMGKRDYNLSGVALDVGIEVIVSGTPGIYKPYGRFSFNARTIELVGEGELKKAYDKLKAKLEKEGVFSDERKRPMPALPQKIGLVTSKDGAAIGDFQVNLGRFGFSVRLIDSRVEGQLAAPELLSAIRSFRNKDIDVLVLVRGGGSLESLLPFNNEALVREIVDFPVPVLVGVGHERDVSLIGLAADKMVSTPTAAAQALNESWQRAANQVQFDQQKLFAKFSQALGKRQDSVQESFEAIRSQFRSIFTNFSRAEQSLLRVIASLQTQIAELHRRFNEYPNALGRGMRGLIHRTRSHLNAILQPTLDQLGRGIDTLKTSTDNVEKILRVNNPERQLRLGYSIARSAGKIVRGIGQIQKGQTVEVRVQDGSFESDITKITKGV